MITRHFFGAAFFVCAILSLTIPSQAVDPLRARVDTTDAHRFAAVFEATRGRPSAADLQEGYLNNAGRGVMIFMPDRIKSAANLANIVNANPMLYADAIERCLPIVESATLELRSIYLGMRGLFPDADLPEIHVVFGADNSGGTAGEGAQVLGLEVICRLGETEADIKAILRTFFAHETVHALQPVLTQTKLPADPLLMHSLREGFADYVAWLVTARIPDVHRDTWAEERRAQVWADFQKDRAILQAAGARGETFENISEQSIAAFRNWHSNAGSAPNDWPSELGYWVGRKICEAYVEAAEDKRAAIQDLLILADPQAILQASGYEKSVSAP